MLKSLKALHGIYDTLKDAQRVLEEDIGRDICMPGCGKCCESNTPVCSVMEAFNAVSVLAGSGGLSAILSTARGWLLDKEKFKIFSGVPYGPLSQELLAERMILIRNQCPFLKSDKSCLIHIGRPIVCRAYGVLREAGSDCPRPPGRRETWTSRAYMDDSQGMFRGAIIDWKSRLRPDFRIYGSVPALIYRCAKPEEFKKLLSDIPSVKLIGSETDTSIVWQEQVTNLKLGVHPNLIRT